MTVLKALAVTALLVLTFAIAQETKPNTTTITSPQIVAKGKLRNQNGPIASTTIFTPPQDGLYRLSVFGTMSQPDGTSNSYYVVNATFTDDGEAETLEQLLAATGNMPGQFDTYLDTFYNSGGPTVTFEAKASTPIAFNVLQYGPPDNSKYSLYYTLERLQ
jgi:hypothetical protein